MKNINSYLIFLVLAAFVTGCEPDPYEVPDIEQVSVKKIYEIFHEVNINGKDKKHTYLDDSRIPHSITLYDNENMLTWYKDARAIKTMEVTNKDESASTEEDFIITFETVERVTVIDDENNEVIELVIENFSLNTSKVNETHGTLEYSYTENGVVVNRVYKVRAKEDTAYN